MEKTKIGPHGFLCPMPMVIVGPDVGGKANFMAVGAQVGKAWSDGRAFGRNRGRGSAGGAP